MHGQTSWVEILSKNEAELLWAKLFKLVSRHSSIRNLFESRRVNGDRLQDLFTDFTQDLFLKLYRKNRWHHYLEAGYVDAEIEHELYHIEIPNLVSLTLRERHPEAYRMARRISDLVQTRPEFRRYARGDSASGERKGKLTLKVYGLSHWPSDKEIRPVQSMHGLIDDIGCRIRDRRRAGRGSHSQIIISNNELTELLVEIFQAIDSPADIRIIRSLALSKLPIEDSRFVSLDAALTPDGASDPEPIQVDFADNRPTPEEILLDQESIEQVEGVAVAVLEKMREMVRNKPKRYRKLAGVAWHCYFDSSSPSQSSIAKTMGISNSLVSHYRKLFDAVVRDVTLDESQYIPFLHAFGKGLAASVVENSISGKGIQSRTSKAYETGARQASFAAASASARF